jgi:hypothetical protein
MRSCFARMHIRREMGTEFLVREGVLVSWMGTDFDVSCCRLSQPSGDRTSPSRSWLHRVDEEVSYFA